MSQLSLAEEIVAVCCRLYDRGLIAGQDGNVSVRLQSGHILVTPTGVSKVDVTPGSLVELTPDGKQVTPGPGASSEIGMHLRIYRERPDVRAIVHAHPPIATAFGVAGRDFMDALLPEVIFHLGRVPLVPFALPGTPALGDAMAPYLADHDAFLLASHGATTVGPTLRLAHQRMESLEHAARILQAASQIGPVTPLRAEDIAALRAAREAARAGWQADALRIAGEEEEEDE
ncbi:MAG TPA: class II aldolase/adducin family protein [Gemmatimonadaceae bacterium]|nr:class II aldolase/adducin family protein [Gemmatimonadaceae bacterium]